MSYSHALILAHSDGRDDARAAKKTAAIITHTYISNRASQIIDKPAACNK